MDRIVVLLTIMLLHFADLHAQQNAEEPVKATVNQLFEGMKAGDAAKVKAAFADSAILQTIVSKDGKVSIRNISVQSFADFVGKQTAGAADEQIRFETVRIDDNLALVWTPYKFYFNGKFSHCGVNSFHLVKLNGQWKIQHLIDTRRKEGCE